MINEQYITCSFKDIDVKENSLIFCDIDDTVLYYEIITSNWWRNNGLNYERWQKTIATLEPLKTCEYFADFLERVEKSNSKVAFVTARNPIIKELTETHLLYLFRNHSHLLWKTELHMLDGTTKGEYINATFEIEKYEHLIFIDDIKSNVDSFSNTVEHDNKKGYHFINIFREENKEFDKVCKRIK